MDYQFYGAPLSYFSGKLRTYLQFKRIPYCYHLASMKAFKEVIVPATGLPLMPILITPEKQVLQDTCDIIDFLEEKHSERPILAPKDNLLHLVMHLFEFYADELLLYPGLFLRWGFPENEPFLYAEFGRSAAYGSKKLDPKTAGKPMADKIKGYLPILGLDQAPAQEATLEVFHRTLGLFHDLLGSQDYVLGETPSLADICFTGPVSAHWLQDPVPHQMIRDRYLNVYAWSDRLQSGNAISAGCSWALNDRVNALLSEIGHQFGAFIADAGEQLELAVQNLKDGDPFPRGGPDYQTSILGRQFTRKLNGYWAYKLQRVRDSFLAQTDQATAKALLSEWGLSSFIEHIPQWRAYKKENRLHFSKGE